MARWFFIIDERAYGCMGGMQIDSRWTDGTRICVVYRQTRKEHSIIPVAILVAIIRFTYTSGDGIGAAFASRRV